MYKDYLHDTSTQNTTQYIVRYLIAKININEINFTLLRATGQLQRVLYVFCIVPNYKYLPSEIGMKISNRLK